MNKFTNEDCMEVMARYPDNHFDLAIVDVEYGIGASSPSKKPNAVKQKNGTTLYVKSKDYEKKDWDTKLSSPEYFSELRRVSKRQLIWGANYYPGLQGGRLVWEKLNGDSDQFDCEIAYLSWTKRTEMVYYLWSGMFQGEVASRNPFFASRQIGDKRKNEKRIHPTQKPVALYKWLLTNYANEGDLILDTHVGSASSLIACEDKGFNYVGCELDPDYFRDANERLTKFRSEPKLNFTTQPKPQPEQLSII